jgi:predicted nucleic acid-binding protein
MPIVFVETSALVKRYVEEQGTEVVDELFERKRPTEFFVLPALAVLELKSALRRLVKGGRLRAGQYESLIAEFSKDVDAFSLLLPVDNALLEEAAASLDQHALRAGDALHFATIMRVRRVARIRRSAR